jgi:hypothetical protein
MYHNVEYILIISIKNFTPQATILHWLSLSKVNNILHRTKTDYFFEFLLTYKTFGPYIMRCWCSPTSEDRNTALLVLLMAGN